MSIGVSRGVSVVVVMPFAYSNLGVELGEFSWSRFKDKPVLIMCDMDSDSGVLLLTRLLLYVGGLLVDVGVGNGL